MPLKNQFPPKTLIESHKHLIGAHFSIAGGLENAIFQAASLGCNVLQLFTKSARTWKEKFPDKEAIKTFKTERGKANIEKVISHASYLINIASDDPEKLDQSIQALSNEMKRSAMLGIDYVVLHPGSYKTQNESNGLEKASESLYRILKSLDEFSPQLVIETTAGQGTNLGYSFEQIAQILKRIDLPDQTGVCIDTSHIFAAGYDIRDETSYTRTMKDFNDIIGFDHLSVLHLNDSKTEFGSKKDRHEHIGNGFIGSNAFKFIMTDTRLKTIPKILETPKLFDKIQMDPVNLEKLLNLAN